MNGIRMEGLSREKKEAPIFTWCSIDLNNSGFSRRCFMTGEYCAQQENIKRERKRLHDLKQIRAFVDMSYSNISDVLYKWRLKSFIETLKNKLYFNTNPKKPRLYCIDRANLSKAVLKALIDEECPEIQTISETQKGNNREALLKKLDDIDSSSNRNSVACEYDHFFQYNLVGNEEIALFMQVKSIDVIRADSDPSSSFVICNRVCQQIQISDLIVADVSVENANVFYELGMAVALGKMILPICYSERYYEIGKKTEEQKKESEKPFEHHIDCFPWRRKLFEHFGIRFRNNSYTQEVLRRRKSGNQNLWKDEHQWETGYLPFKIACHPSHGFSDVRYDRFPYLDRVQNPNDIDSRSLIQPSRKDRSKKQEQPIGQYLYERLARSYNHASFEENTLVIYTMDGILNEAQTARCVINYYHAVVRQFQELNCFRGERVGVLLQSNEIPEDPKDGPKEQPLRYGVGDIIQIGVNQATYRAHMDSVKPNDFLTLQKKDEEKTNGRFQTIGTAKPPNEWNNNAIRYVKEFVRNRGIPIYPEYPLYVKRITDGLQDDIFDDISLGSTNYPNEHIHRIKAQYFFCLYHIMLRTLRFTNEVVVDISTNSVQALFWLGAAHGSDTNAITVRRNETDKERQMLNASSEPRKRGIFDVAGLWTAVYETSNTESFYVQLAKAQSGIESRSRLLLKERSEIEETLEDQFWATLPENKPKEIERLHERKEIKENLALESYYRNYFWRPMLRYNQLHIYLLKDDKKDNNKLSWISPGWDVEAVGLLSNYLSKKTQIGEYRIVLKQESESDLEAQGKNCICVGGKAGPKNLRDSIREITNLYDCENEKAFPNSILENLEVPENGEYNRQNARLIIKKVSESQGNNTQKAVQPNQSSMSHFHVFITGYSGPATKALSSILVDDVLDLCANYPELQFPCEKEGNEDGNIRIYPTKTDDEEIRYRRFPLLTLQTDIRKQLIKRFVEVLDERSQKHARKWPRRYFIKHNLEIGQVHSYFNLVSNITELYLSTVLYRYFLPLLSEDDISRIVNGMKMFISCLRAANRSPFDLQYSPHIHDEYSSVMPEEIIQDAVELVLQCLEDTLRDMQGIQALYEVETIDPKERREKSSEKNKSNDRIDSREIVGIVQRKHGVRVFWNKDSNKHTDINSGCGECPYEENVCKLKKEKKSNGLYCT